MRWCQVGAELVPKRYHFLAFSAWGSIIRVRLRAFSGTITPPHNSKAIYDKQTKKTL
jgi:hypothetical protein